MLYGLGTKPHSTRNGGRCCSTGQVASESAMSHVQQHTRDTHNGIGSEQSKPHDGLELDQIFSLLSNSRRRSIIQAVVEHENIDKNELVWLVAEDEYQLPREEIDSSERHTIYVSLTQSHLDALEEAGVISRNRDRISVGPNMDELMFYLQNTDESLGDKLKRSLSPLF